MRLIPVPELEDRDELGTLDPPPPPGAFSFLSLLLKARECIVFIFYCLTERNHVETLRMNRFYVL
jgi:hypothetical protein